jgi:hypothetical protein
MSPVETHLCVLEQDPRADELIRMAQSQLAGTAIIDESQKPRMPVIFFESISGAEQEARLIEALGYRNVWERYLWVQRSQPAPVGIADPP